jgi:hypothetical protein
MNDNMEVMMPRHKDGTYYTKTERGYFEQLTTACRGKTMMDLRRHFMNDKDCLKALPGILSMDVVRAEIIRWVTRKL